MKNFVFLFLFIAVTASAQANNDSLDLILEKIEKIALGESKSKDLAVYPLK